ncbi:MAG TPA: choice-of-anchor V domain-containing protein [Bacteroidia bacterium]|jgi:hypothetical protein|nr:choice-of-anchor V domain-containing protein [Bacteroidia bacterium]
MRKFLLFALLGIIFIGSTAFIISSGGITGHTGSPGESTCSACHGGGSGTTSVSITGSPAFTANQFIPGQTYTVSVTVSNNSLPKFGFDAEILDPSNSNAGNITSGLTGVQVVNTTRKNVTQTGPKSGTGSAAFQFVWVAPLSGTATIYAAGNAVDGTGSTSGDTPGNTSLTLKDNSSVGINEAVASGISGLNVYPNPVKSDFKISYNLIEKAQIKVGLYDIQGKEITEFANENQNIGANILNAQLPSDLAKGAYFVRLSVEGKQQTQRLIITQ